MKEIKKADILFETFTPGDSQRESYGSSPSSANTKLQEIAESSLRSQLESTVSSMLTSCDNLSYKESSWDLESVKISLGISLEGKLFIASGNVKGGIELQFKKN